MDIAGVFASAVARDPNALAFVDGDLRRSYAEWESDIRRLAGGLLALGLVRGEHLVCIMPNSFEMASLYWACQRLGAIFTPFNWRATEDELAYAVSDADARLVVVDENAAVLPNRLSNVPANQLVTVGARSDGPCLADLLQSEPVGVAVALADEDICLMLYTSGTTGRPKGVPRSVRAERIAAASVIAHLRYRFGERLLGAMPMFHTMGIRNLLCSTMLNGAFVNMRGFDAGAALSLIDDEQVTALFLVPTMYHDMLGRDEFAVLDTGSVRNVAYAGMAMTGALERRCAEAFKPEVFANYYGSSEIFTFSFCDQLDRKPGSAGNAGINQILRVVRADAEGQAGPGDILPTGEIGEVIATLQSPEAFAGYWKRPDADTKAIRDGWYFTGDLGYMDEDGTLFLCGRIDDMIISGGENIHPEEVEDTLVCSALVDAVAIVGLPDERWGQKVVAFVEPASREATAEALDVHCQASTLARFKRPRAYVFVEGLPRSASGKLLRRLLRDGNYTVLTDFKSTL
jgi:2-furoate---CoA ligase